MGTLSWQDERVEAGREANKATLRKIDEMVAAGDRDGVLAATGDWPPVDALACLWRLCWRWGTQRTDCGVIFCLALRRGRGFIDRHVGVE